MGLTRKHLSAMGIEADKVDEIIEMHIETVNAIKAERDNFKKDADELEEVRKELSEAKKTIEAQESDGYKGKYDAIQQEFENYKAGIEAEKTLSAKDKAYRKMLKEAGISEKRIDSIMKVTKLDDVELEGDTIKNVETLTDSIKEEWKDFLTTTISEGARTETPPEGGEGAISREQIYAKDEHGRYKLNAKERQDALAKII